MARFAHRAVWNAADSRMEMHLVSRGAQTVHVGGRAFAFADGETIHTENSHKFTADGFARPGRRGRLAALETWIAPEPSFMVAILSA